MEGENKVSALDELRSQIKFRGLRDSGFNDPVREFKGKLESFDVEAAKFQGAETGRNNIILKFSEVEVISSTEPYPFPNKDISIGYSDRKQSRWGIFAESGLKFLGEQEEFTNLIGRRLHLKIEVHKLFQGKERGEQPTDCWEIVGVEGAGTSSNGQQAGSGISAEKQLLLLLNGKTEQQFNMEALRLQAVKSDSGLTTRILNRSYFAEVTSKGLVAKDDTGVYILTEVGMGELQG